MAALIPSGPSRNKKGQTKYAHSTRVDLTPMVDLGFLLISFFVFTTSLQQPKVMTLLEPADGPPTPVKTSTTLTIRQNGPDSWTIFTGKADKPLQIEQYNSLESLRNRLMQYQRQTAPGDQMILLQAGEQTRFSHWVDLLDEMTVCGIRPGHYAETDNRP